MYVGIMYMFDARSSASPLPHLGLYRTVLGALHDNSQATAARFKSGFSLSHFSQATGDAAEEHGIWWPRLDPCGWQVEVLAGMFAVVFIGSRIFTYVSVYLWRLRREHQIEGSEGVG